MNSQYSIWAFVLAFTVLAGVIDFRTHKFPIG